MNLKEIYDIDITNDVIAFAEQEGDILRSAYALAHIEHSKNKIPLLQRDDDAFTSLQDKVIDAIDANEIDEKSIQYRLLNEYLHNIEKHVVKHTSTELSAPFDTIIKLKDDGEILTSEKRSGTPEIQIATVRNSSFDEQELYNTYNFYERLQTIEREHNPIYDINTFATYLAALLLILPFEYGNYFGIFVFLCAMISWGVFERVPYRREKKLAYVKDMFKSFGKIGFSILGVIGVSLLGALIAKPFFAIGIAALLLGKIRGEI